MAEAISDQPITHPEEMRGDFDLSIGKNIRLTGHGRLTPAGIVTMGIVAVGNSCLGYGPGASST